MATLTLNEARAHCHLEPDYPADQLQPYMDAAEGYVVAHLNRSVFEDQASLDAAQAGMAGQVGTAYDAYQAAIEAAALVENVAQKQVMIDMAEAKYRAADTNARRTINGIVMNGTIRAAMLLILGNLFENRETDVVGLSSVALPTGVPELLRPFRMGQMP